MAEPLTTNEMAATLGVHRDTVRRKICEGEIDFTKDQQGRYYIHRSAIDTLRTTKEVKAVTKDGDATALIERQRTLLDVVQRMAVQLDEMAAKLDEISEELAALRAEHEPVPAPLPVPDPEPRYRERWYQFWLPKRLNEVTG